MQSCFFPGLCAPGPRPPLWDSLPGKCGEYCAASGGAFSNLLCFSMGKDFGPLFFFRGPKKEERPGVEKKKGPLVQIHGTRASIERQQHRVAKLPFWYKSGHIAVLFPLPLHGAVENCAASEYGSAWCCTKVSFSSYTVHGASLFLARKREGGVESRPPKKQSKFAQCCKRQAIKRIAKAAAFAQKNAARFPGGIFFLHFWAMGRERCADFRFCTWAPGAKRTRGCLFYASGASPERMRARSSSTVWEMDRAPRAVSCSAVRLPQQTARQGRAAFFAVSRSTSLSPT